MSDKWLVYNCLSLVVLYYLAHCLLEQLTAEYNYSCSEYSDDSHSEMYQPRGSLARTLYNKQLIDATLETMDQSQWYAVDSHRLHDNIRQVFVPMRADQETHAFLENASHKSDAIFTQIWHSIVKTLLKWFMTQTDINGLLGRGSMFVFSSSQLSRLLERRLGQQGDLLDLGAGDGLITQNLANFFSHVYVTETSRTMRWALMKRGFTLLHLDKWSEKRYDVISCLNLLDRCDQPLSILHQMKHSLKPGGKAIIAVVLPFQPYVEKGRSDHQPTEWLPIKGNTFEDQVNSVVTQVLEPAGFIVELFTRLPYLCEGDLQQAYYWLDDAVFVEFIDRRSQDLNNQGRNLDILSTRIPFQFSNKEFGDDFMYGFCNGNWWAPAHEYERRFPNRIVPNHIMFSIIFHHLQSDGSFPIAVCSIDHSIEQ